MTSEAKRAKVIEEHLAKWQKICSAERELRKTKVRWVLDGLIDDPILLEKIEEFLNQMELSQRTFSQRSSELHNSLSPDNVWQPRVTLPSTMPDQLGQDVFGSI
jgi:CO/xanthine dehydrogenase FAD-binding subunit